VAVRELLTEYGQPEFQETLLELLGAAPLSRARVAQHLTTLTDIFDLAVKAIQTPFPSPATLATSPGPAQSTEVWN